MHIFISSLSTAVLDEIIQRCPGMSLNVLVTIARMPNNWHRYFNKYEKIIKMLAIDSGAFSLNNSLLGISPQQLFARFASFARSSGQRFDLVFSYDESFSPDGFDVNSQYLAELESQGIHVVPVIHNVNNHELDTYINAGYEYVAIGQQKNKTKPEVLFPAVYKLYQQGLKVHLLGITEFSLLIGCPAWSCDSKSWLDDAKTGVVRFWNPENPGIDKTDIIYFPNKFRERRAGTHLYNEYEHIATFEAFLDGIGLTKYDLIGLHAHKYLCLLGVLYYKKIEEVVTASHLNNPLFM